MPLGGVPVGVHQRFAMQRGGQRNLGGGDLVGKGMLFQQLVAVPAVGAVELGHPAVPVFQPHQIHPVLETVEGLQPAVATQTDLFQRGQYRVGCQPGKGLKGAVRRIIHGASPLDPDPPTIRHLAAGGQSGRVLRCGVLPG